MDVFVSAQQFATWFLTGLIWFVQLVHYPSFAGWNPASFAEQHRLHTRSTSVIVAPVMVTELVLSLLTAFRPPLAWGILSRERAVLAFALVVAVWIVTFAVMIPLHDRLSKGYDSVAHRALVQWNWARTVAWTVRAFLIA
jgi:hypothetical protein